MIIHTCVIPVHILYIHNPKQDTSRTERDVNKYKTGLSSANMTNGHPTYMWSYEAHP